MAGNKGAGLLLLCVPLLLSCAVADAAGGTSLLTGVGSSYFDAVLKERFPTGARSDRDLPKCDVFEACNVIHLRYWFSPVVERQCNCADRSNCPWEYRKEDNRTMQLSNRSQLKFCNNTSYLPQCKQNEQALVHRVQTKMKKGSKADQVKEVRHSTNVTCNCSDDRYWKQSNPTKDTIMKDGRIIISTTSYTCSELEFCSSGEFCGHIRADTFSTYYRCKCPSSHMCVMQERKLYDISELHFFGKAYKGVCVPFNLQLD